MFEIKTNDEAIECYTYFHQNKKNALGNFHVYLVKIPEEVYVKYADEEAEKYYKAQEEEREKRKEQRK